MRRIHFSRWTGVYQSVLASILWLALPQQLLAQNVTLDNPLPHSVQSGIGLINGWVCDAEEILIEIDELPALQAAYGTTRADTVSQCGDDDNGFGLTFNWNLVGDGLHRLRVIVDGNELAAVAFVVATLGLGEFPRGLTAEGTIADFPVARDTVDLLWQEPLQNFVLQGPMLAGAGGSGGGPPHILENPEPGSFQSGIGLISGWVCEASTVSILIDELPAVPAAYGTTRADTVSECGDDNNGFGLTFNWNLVGDGEHRVRAFADGEQFADVMFTVTTLGLGEFVRLEDSGTVTSVGSVADFPQSDSRVSVQWQDSQQNFIVEGIIPPGRDETMCDSEAGEAVDANGVMAFFRLLNLCSLNGGTARLDVTVPVQIAPQEGQAVVQAQVEAGAFEFCAADLSFEQGTIEFLLGDFQVFDRRGDEVTCREIAPMEKLTFTISIEADVSLTFREPTRVLYNGVEVVEIGRSPTLSVSPISLDFDIVEIGQSRELNFIVTNSGGGTLSGDVSATAPFSIVSGGTLSLGAGQSQTVTVQFSPTTAGNATGRASVSAAGSSASVSLAGTTPSPVLSVSPTTLDFGTVAVGSSSDQTFSVTNNGGGTLSGDVSTTTPFSIVSGGTFSLGAGQSQTVTVQFSPMTAGDATGSASVSAAGSSASVSLTGTTPSPVLSVSPTTLDFGTVAVGSSSDQTFTVTNTGGGTLSGSVSTAAPFSIVSGGTLSLGAGQSQSVTVRFSPTTAGDATGSTSVSAAGNSASVSLTGTTPSVLSVSPTGLDFGTVGLGGSLDMSFVVTNTGSGTLNGSVSTTAPFSIVSGGTLSLNAGQSQAVTVRYSATTAGAFIGSVGVSSNGGSASISVTGTTPLLSVSTSSLDFGTVDLGSSRDLSFMVTNTGGGTLIGSILLGSAFTNSLGGAAILVDVVAGQSQTVTVRFSPTAAGDATDQASVSTNGGFASVSLTGTTPSPVLSVSPTGLDFGTVGLGGSLDMSFVVTNTGSGTLNGSVSTTAPFSIISGGTLSLAAGQSQPVTVRYSATTGGSFSDSVSVSSNGGSASVSVTGATPLLSVSPSFLDFGDVNCSDDLTFDVLNSGAGTLTGSIGAPTSASFSILSGGGSFSLGPNQSQPVTVRASGAGNSSITISSNGDSATVTLSVTSYGCLI